MNNLYQLAVINRNFDWVEIKVPYNAISYDVVNYTLILDNNYINITNKKAGDAFKVIVNGKLIGTLKIAETCILWKGEKINDAVLRTTLRKAA